MLKQLRTAITDGYTNFMARVGLGTANITSSGKYDYDPLVNNRLELDNMYETSWITRTIVEVPAKDMTKASVTMNGLDTNDHKKMVKAITDIDLWNNIKQTIMWARLYGGALLYINIKDQDPQTPLDLDTVGPDSFEGLEVYNRWQLMPSVTTLVQEGMKRNEPEYYTSIFDKTVGNKVFTIHHSRVIKFVGIPVPWFSKIRLMFWGQSVVVNVHPQIKSYDVVSALIDQLAFKANLRVLSIKGMRDLLALGGDEGEATLLKYTNAMNTLQSIEHLTVIDGEDKFTGVDTTAFTGLKDVQESKGEQLSAATGIPQSKLFGRPSDGLGATLSGDQSNYIQALESDRESQLRKPMSLILDILSRSVLDRELPEDFTFTFDPLRTISPQEQAEILDKVTNSVLRVHDSGVISTEEARAELANYGVITGSFINVEGNYVSDSTWALLIDSGLATRQEYYTAHGKTYVELNTDVHHNIDLDTEA